MMMHLKKTLQMGLFLLLFVSGLTVAAAADMQNNIGLGPYHSVHTSFTRDNYHVAMHVIRPTLPDGRLLSTLRITQGRSYLPLITRPDVRIFQEANGRQVDAPVEVSGMTPGTFRISAILADEGPWMVQIRPDGGITPIRITFPLPTETGAI